MRVEPADLEALIATSGSGCRPGDLDTLIHRLARIVLERTAPVRAYALGGRYVLGERVWFAGEKAEVVGLRRRGNPRQGRFTVLDLKLHEGTIRRVVAQVAGAPQVALSPSIDEDAVRRVATEQREALLQALLTDPRLVQVLDGTVAPASQASQRDSWLRIPPACVLFASPVLRAHLGESAVGATEWSRRLEALSRIWCGAREHTVEWNVGQTWQNFVLPVLRLLGWSASGLAESGAYTLFPDPSGLTAGELRLVQGVALEGSPPVVVVPVRWGGPLGQEASEQVELSPLARMVGALVNRGIEWGILTNGLRWRICHASYADSDVGSAAAETCEFDLGQIIGHAAAAHSAPDVALRTAQRQQLQVWWQLSAAPAYVSSSGEQALVTRLKAASAEYARHVTRTLRSRLLSTILPEICGGFFSYRQVQRGEGHDDRQEMAGAALGLVQRVLFVLYAEARNYLPMDNPTYRGRSLTTQVRWAVECVEQDLPLSAAPNATPRYDHLLALFRDLEHGQAQLGLPAYGGDLFSPVMPVQGFLERHRLSDRVMARTLAALGQLDGEPIDYGALTLRHLSTVADGLLENLIGLVDVSTGPVAMAPHPNRLETPAGPATPDYVGVTVIERALRSVIDHRARLFAAAMDEITALRRQGALRARPIDDVGWRAALLAAERKAYEALLGIRVLDPAMGTGFFLVCAVDILIDGIMAALADYHARYPRVPVLWNPIYRDITATRQVLLEAARTQELVVAPRLASDDAILARLVVERAIYGVDTNPTAVSVSRANVAMRGFLLGAPLPLLDRHMRCGNSLLGARLCTLASDDSGKCQTGPAVLDVGAVRAAASAHTDPEAFSAAVRPYELLLDLWTYSQAGDADATALLHSKGTELIRAIRGEQALEPGEAEVVDRARRCAAEQGYLHWDVAFPEVFLGSADCGDGEPGFDAIIGSPPALRLGTADRDKTASEPDVSAFVVRARQLVRKPHGRVAFLLTPYGGEVDV